jgi:hypothetical protein
VEQPVEIACTLGSREEIESRLIEWRDVVGLVVDREKTETGMRLTFPADPVVAAAIARLAVLEQRCCAFFSFTIEVRAGGLVLDVSAPENAGDLVEGLLASG